MRDHFSESGLTRSSGGRRVDDGRCRRRLVFSLLPLSRRRRAFTLLLDFGLARLAGLFLLDGLVIVAVDFGSSSLSLSLGLCCSDSIGIVGNGGICAVSYSIVCKSRLRGRCRSRVNNTFTKLRGWGIATGDGDFVADGLRGRLRRAGNARALASGVVVHQGRRHAHCGGVPQ